MKKLYFIVFLFLISFTFTNAVGFSGALSELLRSFGKKENANELILVQAKTTDPCIADPFANSDCLAFTKANEFYLNDLEKDCKKLTKNKKLEDLAKYLYSVQPNKKIYETAGFSKRVDAVYLVNKYSIVPDIFKFSAEGNLHKKELDIFAKKIFDMIPDSIREKIFDISIVINLETSSDGMITFAGVGPSDEDTNKKFLGINYLPFLMSNNDKERVRIVLHEFGHIVEAEQSEFLPTFSKNTCENYYMDVSPTKKYCLAKGSPLNQFWEYFFKNQIKRTDGTPKYLSGSSHSPNLAHEEFAENFSLFTMWCFLSKDEKKKLSGSSKNAQILWFNFRPDMKKYRNDILERLTKSSLLK